MKVAIITQPLLLNYGGILQNYALQQILKILGHTPITIDHSLKYSRIRWLLGRIKSLLLFHYPNSKIKYPKYGRLGNNNFKKFIRTNITATHPIGHQIPSAIISKYNIDACIVGSDQIWRPCYNQQNLYNMFLDFIPKSSIIKRISYAASFGTDNWEYNINQQQICKDLISKFDAISVREQSAINICQHYFDVSAIQVLDPTLLLPSNNYLNLCKNIKKKQDKYIFYYILDYSKEKNNIVQSFALKHGLNIISRSAHESVSEQDSIEEWLSLFRDAQYVITDSFHGTVFSIIFQKDFYTIPNQSRGQSRIESLLTQLNLQSRIIHNEEFYLNSIDWEDVDAKLSNLQAKSISFLISALNE